MVTKRALNQYKKDLLESEVANATPHRLIQMLLEGALNNIRLAKNYLDDGNIAEKGEKISRTISIIECLRASLNHEASAELAGNLEGIYEYTQQRLLESNINNDQAGFDEAINLLSEIKTGWDAISPDRQTSNE